MRTRLVVGAIIAIAVLFVAACGDSQPSAQRQETKIQQTGYASLTKSQPAQTMSFSPTRKSINFWIVTWNQPNKLAYTYMQAANGEITGYYIFEGPPVSSCAALTPTERVVDEGYEGALLMKAPSIDGVFYSGGQCNAYYGKDAVSGAYYEFTVGNGQNYILSDQPLPRQNVPPIGTATVNSVK